MNPLSNLEKYDVILASGSPRRRELLSQIGVNFRVMTIGGVDESYPDTLEAEKVPAFLSRLKADAYKGILVGNHLIITADTVVLNDGKVVGKPADRDDACRMLRELSGRTHIVISGVTVTTAERQATISVTTEVDFAPLSDEEIEYYVDSYLPLDKAGAYGIQEWIGGAGITGIRGSFYNVMGLPLQRLYALLKTF